MKLDRQQITNILTIVIVLVWIVTAVVRIWVDWPQAMILDSAMPIVIGYWFASSAMTSKKNGNGHDDGYVGEHRLAGT